MRTAGRVHHRLSSWLRHASPSLTSDPLLIAQFRPQRGGPRTDFPWRTTSAHAHDFGSDLIEEGRAQRVDVHS